MFSLIPLLGSSYPVPPCVCVASSVFSRSSRSFYSSISSCLSHSLPPSHHLLKWTRLITTKEEKEEEEERLKVETTEVKEEEK